MFPIPCAQELLDRVDSIVQKDYKEALEANPFASPFGDDWSARFKETWKKAENKVSNKSKTEFVDSSKKKTTVTREGEKKTARKWEGQASKDEIKTLDFSKTTDEQREEESPDLQLTDALKKSGVDEESEERALVDIRKLENTKSFVGSP